MKRESPEERDEEELREIAAYYDKFAANDSLLPRPVTKHNDYAFIEVPKKLLPVIRKLIAEYEWSRKVAK